jgi:alpha/beta superfamily hydrolase
MQASHPFEAGVRFPSTGTLPVMLEGWLGSLDDGAKHAAVVLCHPGIQEQTGMEYPIISACTAALHQASFVTLRFNFRGVQGSTGQRSGGRHEPHDVLGAFQFLCQQPGVDRGRVYLLGNSFGAWMALEAARQDETAAGLVCIVFPLSLVPSMADDLRHDRRPKLFVAAEHDQFCDLQTLRTAYQEWAEPKDLIVLKGSDHFLGIGPSADSVNRAPQIAADVASWLRQVAMATTRTLAADND